MSDIEVTELLDFDIENQDITEFDPLVYKLTPEIEALLETMDKINASKQLKPEVIKNIVATINGVPYAGDDRSQNRMTSVLSIANWQHNKNIGPTLRQVAESPDTDDVTRAMLLGLAQIFDGIYQTIYKDIKVDWKGADDKLHSVQVESIATALYTAMQQVGEVIKKAESGDLVEE